MSDFESSLSSQAVTGLVLAGGLGRRMSADGQGVNKGLQRFRGRPLIAHVLERLRPQVASILINANDRIAEFEQWGLPVVRDQLDGFQGPLAGLQAGLSACETGWLVTVPCDSPFLATDLIERLWRAAQTQPCEIAVASHEGQWQPVFALVRRDLLPDLTRYLQGGDRKIDRWFEQHRCAVVEFDDAQAFLNFNRLDELHRYES